MEIRVIIKYLTIGILGWLVLSNAWPVYSGAYKVRKAMMEAAHQGASGEMLKSEVIDKAYALIKATGNTNVEKADLSASRSGREWVINANYEVKRQFYGNTFLVYNFDIATDRKLLWVRDQTGGF